MKKLLSISLFAAITMISCKQELQPQESLTDTDAPSTMTDASTDNPIAPAPAMPEQPQQTMSAPQSMPNQPAMQAPAKVAAGMNPAHGQPGHRCDIAVGAPLSSAPTKQATSNPMTMTPAKPAAPAAGTPALLNPNSAAPATVTAAGMNPPHGQPGHRCDVSVGAPLPK